MECLSASLYTATERTPIFLAVRITRHAISPRLAISTFSILATPELQIPATLFSFYSKNMLNVRGREDIVDTYVPQYMHWNPSALYRGGQDDFATFGACWAPVLLSIRINEATPLSCVFYLFIIAFFFNLITWCFRLLAPVGRLYILKFRWSVHFLHSPPEKSLTPLLLHDSFLGREEHLQQSYHSLFSQLNDAQEETS